MHFILNFYVYPPDLVIASAGDDKKISFWHKKGRCLAVLPDPGTNVGDNIEVSQRNEIFDLD